MDAIADLTLALAEWRQLTDLEGEAIRSDNWQGLAKHQTWKTQLQAEIQSALAFVRAAPSAQEHTSRIADGQFDSVVGELVALESRNRDLIAAKRTRRQAESEGLSRTLHDLHGVKRAYGSGRSLHWQCYS